MQVNLQNSKTATDNFNQLTMEMAIDIAFIQEPYIYENQITGISRKHRIFACGNGRKKAAIFVANKDRCPPNKPVIRRRYCFSRDNSR
jgi:hypothetical protein